MDPQDAYKFCPKCGNNLESGKEALGCVSCGYHFYINPAPCCGAIIENEKKEIMLVRRRFDPKKGCWDVPGGFMHPLESFEDSMSRELREELGVETEIMKITGVYPDTYDYQGIIIYTICIMAAVKIISGTLKAADDIDDYRFFPKNEIKDTDIAFASVRIGLTKYIAGLGA